ncbi:MAG: DNA cytosine methyltransferase [Bacillota bacterium]
MKAIDLFSGCGGVSCGLTQSGFEVVKAVEIDAQAVAAYKNYTPLHNVDVIHGDIRKVSGENILENTNIEEGELYLLAGCPPCQKFSMQNRKNNLDESNREQKEELLNEFLRIIQELYPPFILMENVPGIKSLFKGVVLQDFLAKLRNDGTEILENKYHVKYDVVNAADYGVPQRRRRFVLHAVRMDIYENLIERGIEWNLPAVTHSQCVKDSLKPWVTVDDAIMDLPAIVAGQRYQDESVNNHYCSGLSDTNLERIRIIRKNGGSRDSLPERLVLKCHKSYTGHKDVYGIMKHDEPAPTITGGCTCYSKGRFGHPYQDRAISVREAARLQTFPDDFIFGESITKASLEIGNAVPVKLVKASGDEILKVMTQLMNE